ncbi:MAG: malonate transporter subunit MadL [Rubripirellula sp.]
MAIYGTALLSICLMIGLVVGQWIGKALGLQANVGGVGIAMLLLIVACDFLQRNGRLARPTEQGVLFWSAIYIPIVVAMAASQNVIAALSSGAVPILAGVLSVVVCFAMVPLISRIGGKNEQPLESDKR